MPLYDTSADVIRKALRGLNLAPAAAAVAANIPEKDAIAATRGEASRVTLEKIAKALALDPIALAGLDNYNPSVSMPAEITRLELPFDDETVNAWLIQSGNDTLLFDTGEGEGDVAKALDHEGVNQVEVFITHSHHDHVNGMAALGSRMTSNSGPVGAAIKILSPGDRFQRGSLSVRVIDLPGHCSGAIGYVIDGLSVPVCVTGDALFAGSMGGCAAGDPYHDAIAALRDGVLSLQDDTVILTGHGPATTVGQEKHSNPFVATASRPSA